MTGRTSKMALWAAAGVSLLLGSLLSLHAARSIGAAKVGLARRMGDLGKLQAIGLDLSRYDAACQAFAMP